MSRKVNASYTADQVKGAFKVRDTRGVSCMFTAYAMCGLNQGSECGITSRLFDKLFLSVFLAYGVQQLFSSTFRDLNGRSNARVAEV